MWDLIVSVPDHCLFFYFTKIRDTLTSVIQTGQSQFIARFIINACRFTA